MHLLSVFSLRNRALIALVTIVIGIFGGIALTSLKQELIPSVTFPQLVVVTAYPGASPAVVNEDVSTPIETAIQGVAGLESTTATSRANVSTVSASFVYGTDITTTEQKVQLAINRISAQLPADADPLVITGSIDDLPVIQIAVTSDLDPRDLSTQLEATVIDDIQGIEGVREASLLGTTGQRVTITPDVAALAASGLSTQNITDALDANGLLLPAGEITQNDETLVVQAGVRLESTDDLASLPVLGGTTTVVTIADLATVKLVDDPTAGISRVNGEPALTVAVTKTPAGNTVAVSELVNEMLPDLAKSLGNNTEFTVVFDQAPFIQQSIDSLATEGLLGLIFAVIVILVFLMSLRSTLVTAISIPASVLITFIGMYASGYTLNIITLGALTISIGRVVDDSIVVIENIKRHLGLGETKREAIVSAVREVAGAITASTVTTVAVFLPLALVGDITGELFRPFALTVTIALAASLFVSLTIVPVLAYWFLPLKAKVKKAHRHVEGAPAPAEGSVAQVDVDSANSAVSATTARSAVVETPAAAPGSASSASAASAASAADAAVDELDTPTRLQRSYLPVIHWTLKRPIVTLLAAVLVLGGTVALIPQMETNFIGDSGQNTLTVSQELPLGASLEAQDAAATEVETVLRDIDGIETVQLSIGSGSGSIADAFGGGGGITFSLTTDPDADQEQLQERVRDAVADISDAGEISLAAAASGFASSDIEIDITAANEADLRAAAEALTAAVADLDVVAEASSNLAVEQPYIAISVDRARAAEAGLSELAVGGIVTAAMNPSPSGTVTIDETTLSIYIENSAKPMTIEQLQGFTIPSATGLIPLTDVATVEEVNGPASITTIRGARSATVSVTPNGDDVGTASTVVADAIADVDLPPSATAELGGVTSQQSDAFSQLGLALLIAILIVYIVMVATFRSLRQPLLLLVSVPFAATGAILLQIVSGIPLGVPSLIGVLMLIGIVVTNAIVLIDLVNQYRDRGLKVGDAIVHGASRRLRPILMTALATIFALLPMALGITGHGGFISQPLAIVVIGGLISSTLLTLVVLPALYYLVEGAKERRIDRRAAAAAPDRGANSSESENAANASTGHTA
jgi:HAE1 family hydrophobic/amphiphilic exporter-1